MRFISMVVLVVASSCAPTLYLTRPTPPEGSFGSVRTLSVDVHTNMGRSVENAVVNGFLNGEVPVPVPFDQIVRAHLLQRLQGLGFVVCDKAPCGDGAMNVQLTESSVGTQLGSGQSHARISLRMVVRQNDGQEPFDFSFWERRSGNVGMAVALVNECAEGIAARFEATMSPGRQKSELPLVDGGPLNMGVNMLLSSNWGGAIQYFNKLVADQPELDGAWYDLGVAWEAYGDWGQALAAYEQAAARRRSRTYLDAVESARAMAPVAPPQQGPVPQIIPPAP